MSCSKLCIVTDTVFYACDVKRIVWLDTYPRMNNICTVCHVNQLNEHISMIQCSYLTITPVSNTQWSVFWYLYFEDHFAVVCCWRSNRWCFCIGLGNGSASKRIKTITWTNTFASDRCLIDIILKVFAIWVKPLAPYDVIRPRWDEWVPDLTSYFVKSYRSFWIESSGHKIVWSQL